MASLRLLVTGAGGQVGTEMTRRAPRHGLTALGLARADLDIADSDAVLRAVDGAGADVVVNCAAYTAVDTAESEPEQAAAINRDAPGHLARACAAAGIPLLHISTDYVFDGTKSGAWTEADPVAPLGVYGRTKEEGERAVREATDAHVILRTSWVFAGHGGNFVRTMLRVGAERDELRVVADQHGAPTYAGDIAEALIAIARRAVEPDAPFGTYHYTARGATTWHGLAEEIFRRVEPRWGRHPTVHAIPTSDYPTPAKRPANSVLDCARVDAGFAPPRRDWREGLADALSELLED